MRYLWGVTIMIKVWFKLGQFTNRYNGVIETPKGERTLISPDATIQMIEDFVKSLCGACSEIQTVKCNNARCLDEN